MSDFGLAVALRYARGKVAEETISASVVVPARSRAVFDDPNLLAHVGLAPFLTLADRAGLPGRLAGAQPAAPCGTNAVAKAMFLVAGMAADADSIDDMDESPQTRGNVSWPLGSPLSYCAS